MTPREALTALWKLLESETDRKVSWVEYPAYARAREAHDVLSDYLDDHVQPEEEDS
jgi:hypothetical protein